MTIFRGIVLSLFDNSFKTAYIIGRQREGQLNGCTGSVRKKQSWSVLSNYTVKVLSKQYFMCLHMQCGNTNTEQSY
jgi:hypothetical protein